MKGFLLALLFMLVISTGLFARSSGKPAEPTGKFMYTSAAGNAKLIPQQLYTAAMDWVALNFSPGRMAVQLKDAAHLRFRSICHLQDTFKLMEPNSYQTGANYALLPVDVSYTMEIEVKQQQCLITISDLHFRYYIPENSFANAADTVKVVANIMETQYELVEKMKEADYQKDSWLRFFTSCDQRVKAYITSFQKHISTATTGKGDAF